MSVQKQRREIVKTWKHLINWHVQRPEADQRFDDTAQSLLLEASRLSGIDVIDIVDKFPGTPLYVPFFTFCMDELLLGTADTATPSMVQSFLAKKGWREKPVGRRYLQLFQESKPQLFDIVGVEPGVSVSVRPAASKLPAILVTEASASQELQPYDCLFARILPMPHGKVFAPGLLPVDCDIGQLFGGLQLDSLEDPTGTRTADSTSVILEQPLRGQLVTAWTLRALAVLNHVDESLGSIDYFATSLLSATSGTSSSVGMRPGY